MLDRRAIASNPASAKAGENVGSGGKLSALGLAKTRGDGRVESSALVWTQVVFIVVVYAHHDN